MIILLGIVFGCITYNVAKRKGYNERLGFFVGGFLSLLGLVIYALLPKTDAKRISDLTKQYQELEIIKNQLKDKPAKKTKDIKETNKKTK